MCRNPGLQYVQNPVIPRPIGHAPIEIIIHAPARCANNKNPTKVKKWFLKDNKHYSQKINAYYIISQQLDGSRNTM